MPKANLGVIIAECMKGKSLYRALFDLRCKSVALSGQGLDLGGGWGKIGDGSLPGYHHYLSTSSDVRITGVDLIPRGGGMIQADLEKALPILSKSQNFVLAMNVLEHLFDYRTCVQEGFRVLCPDGIFVGVVPFLKNVHGDPDDYFRFTASALERILTESGFRTVKVEPLGFGPITSGVSQVVHLLKSSLLMACAWGVSIILDRALNTIFPNVQGVRASAYPLGYFFVAKKNLTTS